jgi:hypothetical protein
MNRMPNLNPHKMNTLKAAASLVIKTSTRACRFLPMALLLAAVIAPLAESATETPPNRMTVQSYITDDTGTPLGNTTAVNKKMVFIIYTADTGGTVSFADEQIVTVDKGHFSVVLGEGSSVGDESHDLATAFSGADASDRFIEIQVSDTDGSNPQTLSPRLRLLPSAYSFLSAYANEAAKVTGGGIDTAAIAENAVDSSKVADGSLTILDLGAGSVGTSEVVNNSLTASDLAPDSVGNSELKSDLTLSGNLGVNQRWPNVTLGLKSVNVNDYLIYGLNGAGQNNFWVNSAGTLYAKGGLASNMVNSAAVTNNTLTASDLAPNSVGASEIAANAVAASEIAANAVGSSEISPNINFATGIGVNHYAYPDVVVSLEAQTGDNYLIYAEKIGGGRVYSVSNTGVVYSASDLSLKTEIEPLEGSLEGVLKLKPSSYRFRESPEGDKEIGFIAQDVQKVFPQVVDVNERDGVLGLAYQSFGVIAIGAIQELNEKVVSLESENAALNERLTALETLVQSLAQ